MENPWKRYSKISPQAEDGYCRMNNQVLDMLIRVGLTRSEYKVALFVWRKTWGFGKLEDAISISQFVEATGLSDRGIRNACADLKSKKIIYYKQIGPLKQGSPLNVYLFNKYYDTWSAIPLKRTSRVKYSVGTGEVQRHGRVKRTSPTKDILTKDTLLAFAKLVSKYAPSIQFNQPDQKPGWSPKRIRNLKARLKDYPIDDIFWIGFLEKIENSDFLTGRIQTDRGWTADLDWILLPSNFNKIMEGRYDNRGVLAGTNPELSPAAQRTQANLRKVFEEMNNGK